MLLLIHVSTCILSGRVCVCSGDGEVQPQPIAPLLDDRVGEGIVELTEPELYIYSTFNCWSNHSFFTRWYITNLWWAIFNYQKKFYRLVCFCFFLQGQPLISREESELKVNTHTVVHDTHTQISLQICVFNFQQFLVIHEK